MQFSNEQNHALELVASGKNVFISGPAGTGKSTILNKLKEENPELPVTATTGIAAVNVGGITFHSWAGLGLLDRTADDIARFILKKHPKARNNILKATQIAVDEVSMLNAKNLDTINRVFQIIRKNNQPFGGIQMIFLGDFCQLPPVSRSISDGKLAFESQAWQHITTLILHQIFRQKDMAFAHALNDIRLGTYSQAAAALLQHRYQKPDPEEESCPPVIIHTHNAQVDAFNAQRLAGIPGETVEFTAADSGTDSAKETLAKYCIAPELLTLKIGARVMLLANLDQKEGLVNGACGFVSGFLTTTNYPIVDFDNGCTQILAPHAWEIKDGTTLLGTRKQIPLRLAWANTAHKIQGLSLDKIKVHLEGVFEYGQAYVALSRVKTLDGLFIADGTKSSIKAHPKAVRFYQNHTMP